MPYQKNPTVTSSQKPVNIFYVWYSELCRRLNSSPAPVVRPAKNKCQTVLDFTADRLKVEEWSPVINALRHDTSLHVIAIKSRIGNCQFLHEVDTEEKVRHLKRKYGSLWTSFILKSLLKSLSCTVRNNQVLSCLELDGLPMFAQYLEPLLKALQKNKTLKTLSLTRCRINDVGCEMVCTYVRFSPNIEIMDLSGCGLTAVSGAHLAKLIKYQQINRYCESWHNSLRYSDPNIHAMRGIKRITLNSNPYFGDVGLEYILNELIDDLWIKALDMQKCGITENISRKIIEVVECSQSLEIVDFRLNDELSVTTVEKILSILKQKQLGAQTEYQWCNTTFSLTCEGSVLDSASNCTNRNKAQVHKARSVPTQMQHPTCSKMSIKNNAIRRIKTTDNVPNNNNKSNGYLGDVEKKLMELNCQLQEEIARRQETEKLNEQLKKTLNDIKSVTNFQVQLQTEENMKSLISAIGNFAPKQNGQVVNGTSVVGRDEQQPHVMLSKMCNGTRNGHKNGTVHKNGVASNGYHKNGLSANVSIASSASTMFEKLVSKDKLESDDNDGAHNHDNNDDDDLSASQVSLFKFMQNLKNDKSQPVNIKKRPDTSKRYNLADKHVKK